LTWIKQSGNIAIGWGLIGDIRAQGFGSSADISQAIKEHYPGLKNSGNGGPSLWNLFSEAQKGDLVILSADKSHVQVVGIESDHFWTEHKPHVSEDYQHQRRVKMRYLAAEKLWHKIGGLIPGQSRYLALACCARNLEPDDVY
jgi:predicted Mrr-cat superfamily restriction endonuclease